MVESEQQRHPGIDLEELPAAEILHLIGENHAIDPERDEIILEEGDYTEAPWSRCRLSGVSEF
ncbi:hypothetical protein HY389_01760 [Candidatus Daviesbacteria bacterium]|nr:hypothetical protein [Candidatus Daviesbacteria bacterium]